MAAWGFAENRETYDALVDAYTSPGRFYHSLEHIETCLRHLDGCAASLAFPREVETALWFHDAIYKPFSGNNEMESADWAAEFLSRNGADREGVARVHALIMATRHNAPPQTADEAVLIDIDLAILGADPAVYQVFEQGVRSEYKLVPLLVFRKKRAEILREFLKRPQIYTSGVLPEAVEHQARENLKHAIASLEGHA